MESIPNRIAGDALPSGFRRLGRQRAIYNGWVYCWRVSLVAAHRSGWFRSHRA